MSAILEALIKVGEVNDLALHFGAKPKHMALHIDRGGRLVKCEYQEERPVRLPWPVSRTGGLKPNLLFDSAKYILVEGPARAASRELHETWAAACQKHPAVKAVQLFFASSPPVVDIPKKHAPLFLVFYFDGLPVCEVPEFRDAIGKILREQFTFVEYQSRFDDVKECILDTHTKVSFPGLDNSQALLTFDADVTWGAGLSEKQRMLHAPMGYEAMRRYTSGLEWLRQNRLLPTPSTKGGGDVSYLGWSETPHRMEQILPRVLGGCPKGTKVDEWRLWLEENLDADRALFDDPTPFYIMNFLCSSKISVRGFHTTTVGELASRLTSYLDDFWFATTNGPKRSSTSPYWILRAGGPGLHITVSLVERLFEAILLGAPYPSELLDVAFGEIEKASAENASDSRNVFAEALFNAVSNRAFPELAPVCTPMTQLQSPVLKNPLFIAGRIFAAFEGRNFAAKDRSDAAKISGMFSRAARHPGLVLSDLYEQSEYHAQKLENHHRRAYRGDIGELFLELEETLQGDELPAHTSKRERAYFVRGREYQRQVQRLRAAERRAAAEAGVENSGSGSEGEGVPEEGV